MDSSNTVADTVQNVQKLNAVYPTCNIYFKIIVPCSILTSTSASAINISKILTFATSDHTKSFVSTARQIFFFDSRSFNVQIFKIKLTFCVRKLLA